ncbi:MAG TPA: ABC transporter permease [Mycobacterium sp.]|uniref:ABC transporter permease n=1 Tax=Mycobacterium sp. TaxID=1785 RepID=UPI002D4CEB2D|nr:ABC transporter permease [Mycobacterium sp.]HZU47039.1 ABC transporter permease [Mycobacterium sp.]
MVGANYNYLDLLDRKIIAGSWFTEKQVDEKERVAILGPEAVALLWGPRAPADQIIGSPIRIEHSVFKVIGVLNANGQNDNVVIVPFASARAYLVGDNAGEVDQIVVKSTDVETLDRAVAEIVRILDASHHIRKPTERDYNVLTYTTLLEKSRQFITFLALFIVAIAQSRSKIVLGDGQR